MNNMNPLDIKPFDFANANYWIVRLENQFRRHDVKDENEKAMLLLRTMDNDWVRKVNHYIETSNPRNIYSGIKSFIMKEFKKFDKKRWEEFNAYIAPANMPPSEVYEDIRRKAPLGTDLSVIKKIWMRNHRQHEKLYYMALATEFNEYVEIAEKAWRQRRTRTLC